MRIEVVISQPDSMEQALVRFVHQVHGKYAEIESVRAIRQKNMFATKDDVIVYAEVRKYGAKG